MRESLADAQEFRLAEWLVIPAAGVLQCAHTSRRVPPRLMRLLLVLASRSQQVVAKDEIIERVWDNQDASDDSVCASIYQLRKALGDQSARPRYIETIPKRGYRMLVDAEFQAATPSREAVAVCGAGAAPTALGSFPVDATDAYERGRALIGSPRSGSLLQAQMYFEHAIAREPRFAAAYACLASVQVGLLFNQRAGWGWADRARHNARAALEIDPALGEAHAAQGLVLAYVEGNLLAADAAYRTALALRPGLVMARRRHALFLAVMGRDEEAMAQLAEAARHDPLNVWAQHENAHIFFVLRRFDRAAAELLKILSREPRSWASYAKLAFVHWSGGDWSQLHTTYRAAAIACDTRDFLARIDDAFARRGAAGLYATVARHLEDRNPERRFHLPELISAHIAAGEQNRAMELLESECEHGNPHVIWMLRTPYTDSLQTRADFRSLVERYAPRLTS
jgi:DNA-binding winged helix-turn-helix (wHTH) protein/tetratricopeptide (TPR) repeat protein